MVPSAAEVTIDWCAANLEVFRKRMAREHNLDVIWKMQYGGNLPGHRRANKSVH